MVRRRKSVARRWFGFFMAGVVAVSLFLSTSPIVAIPCKRSKAHLSRPPLLVYERRAGRAAQWIGGFGILLYSPGERRRRRQSKQAGPSFL